MQKQGFAVIALIAVAFAIFEFTQKSLPANGGRAVPAAVNQDGISVYFSPNGGCEAAIVGEIRAANKTIDMQAYSFTSLPIATALGDAQQRGVKVRAILDRKDSTERGSKADELPLHGIETYTDGQHPIAHNKIIIIDGQTIITGSFNFTHQAEHENAENLLIITGRLELAKEYENNFEHHLSHSVAFGGGEHR